MKKSQTNVNDIATEPYRGPSAHVAAAGQGFLEHIFYAVTGLVTAGALAFIFHEPAAKIVKNARDLGSRLKDWEPKSNNGIIQRSGDTLSNWAGGALHVAFGDEEAAETIASLSSNNNHQRAEWLANVAHDKRQGFGNGFLSHTIGLLPWVGGPFKRALRGLGARSSTAIAFGGAAGVIGYIGGWLKAIIQGAKHGNEGKNQFQRAQEEIKNLRELNADLERINNDLHKKYVEAATSLNGIGKETAKSAAEKPSEVALESAQHDGTLQAEKALEPQVV